MPAGVPYLSVVVTSRNDGHGGTPNARFQAFLNCLVAQCDRIGLRAELIVVEWNPPAEQPRLRDVLVCRGDASHCEVRFIEVPAALHARLRQSDRLPLFQMIAKNVGIRRARGQFVLSTNIDVLLSNELVDHIAAGKLEPGTLYRIDRRDVDTNVPIDAPLDDMLAYCQSHQLRRHTQRGTFPVSTKGSPALFPDDIVAADAGILLGEGWHAVEGVSGAPARWAGSRAELLLDETIVSGTLNFHCEPDPFGGVARVELRVVDDRGQVLLPPVAVSCEQVVQVAIPRGATKRLWVEALSGGSAADALPLFEYRDDLRYRVRRLSWHDVERNGRDISAPRHSYPLDAWHVSEGSDTAIKRTDRGMEVVTDGRKGAYAVELGPLIAPAPGTYRLDIRAKLSAGSIVVRALSGDRTHWIAEATRVLMSDGEQSFLLMLTPGLSEEFFVVACNDSPHDSEPARFLLNDTRGDRAYADVSAPLRTPSARKREWLRPPLRRLLRKLIPTGEPQREVPGIRERGEPDETRTAVERLVALEPLYRFLSSVRPDPSHTNACGDFQLMAKQDWFNLRGYPELEMFSMNVDELFNHVAHYAGLREQVFADPMCAYHIEHAAGSGWTPEGGTALRQRIQDSGIDWLDHNSVTVLASYMKFLRRPMIFNGGDWGLAEHQLPETTTRHHGV
jgi:hypothetical protein